MLRAKDFGVVGRIQFEGMQSMPEDFSQPSAIDSGMSVFVAADVVEDFHQHDHPLKSLPPVEAVMM
jgi:hypothetical protein